VVLRGHERAVMSASWSPDGNRIVTTSFDRTADGKRIVTTSFDNTARVWNADGSSEPVALDHENAVNSASWSPDGTWIVTVSDDQSARVWQITVPALQHALHRMTVDCLSPAQRETYLLETKPVAVAAYQACERTHGRTPRP
jgi:WD40 repeat protein